MDGDWSAERWTIQSPVWRVVLWCGSVGTVHLGGNTIYRVRQGEQRFLGTNFVDGEATQKTHKRTRVCQRDHVFLLALGTSTTTHFPRARKDVLRPTGTSCRARANEIGWKLHQNEQGTRYGNGYSLLHYRGQTRFKLFWLICNWTPKLRAWFSLSSLILAYCIPYYVTCRYLFYFIFNNTLYYMISYITFYWFPIYNLSYQLALFLSDFQWSFYQPMQSYEQIILYGRFIGIELIQGT